MIKISIIFFPVGANYVEPTMKFDFEVTDTGDRPLTRAQKKNMRKKQKKKESKSSELAFEIEEVICGMEGASIDDSDVKELENDATGNSMEKCDTEISAEMTQRKLRTLKKKLKQIKELEAKISTGDLKPDKEQLKKILRKGEIQAEIEMLS